MPSFRIFIPVLAIIFFATGCRTGFFPAKASYKYYQISGSQSSDETMTGLLKPYTDSVNNNMSDVIAVAGMELKKMQPDGPLGNVLADAMLLIAKEKYGPAVEASLINFGGIRLNAIPAGPITRGKIFEICPFDNIIVVLNVSGSVLQQLLDLVALKGGWPCAGITFILKNKKAVDCMINGRAINEKAVYKIALPDYIANGGDNCGMLMGIPQQNNGYVFRDELISYFIRLNKNGIGVNASGEKRITYAE